MYAVTLAALLVLIFMDRESLLQRRIGAILALCAILWLGYAIYRQSSKILK